MNRRDTELLSAYLDGELKPSDISKLESRLKSDPELTSVLSDLRATRTLLRRLPTRKAPRNFTLTRRMIGQNPPLPRTYPVFRLATTIATLLFFFTFGINFVGSQFAASQPMAFGMGGGGGGDAESYVAEAPAAEPAMEEPAAPAEEPFAAVPAPELTELPAEPEVAMDEAAEEQPPVAMVPMPTATALTDETSRIVETPVLKNGAGEGAAGETEQTQLYQETPSAVPLISSAWQIGLAVITVVGLLAMGLMRQLSARRWK